ncbi:MAG: hypothetical protein H0Z39_04685 [Peptococcaceae bacterium]|nr:hypothetical protein [Peptococcaceae bacterium]
MSSWWEPLLKGKKQQNLVLLLIGLLGVALLVFGSFGSGGGSSGPPPIDGASTASYNTKGNKPENSGDLSRIQAEEQYLSEQLENMLRQIDGVGDVDVTVRLEGSSVTEYARNQDVDQRFTDESRPGEGGGRTINENSTSNEMVVISREGYEVPVLEREIAPRVKGVLVVAEGARSPKIKSRIFNAIQIGLGVEAHKIVVMPRRF